MDNHQLMANLLNISAITVNTSNLISFLIISTLVYGLLLVAARLTIYPLARFPGRKFAAASKWYEFYYDIIKTPGGQYAREVSKMHDQYGPIIRINPDEIHIRDSHFFDTVYAPAPARRDKYPPAAQMTGIPLSSFGTVHHDLHKLRKRPNAQMFSTRAIHGRGQSIMIEGIAAMSRSLRAAHDSGELINIRKTSLAFTSVFGCRYFLDVQLPYHDDPVSLDRWYAATLSVPDATPLVKQFPWMPSMMMKLPTWLVETLSKDVAQVLGIHTTMQNVAREFLDEVKYKPKPDDGEKETPKTLLEAIFYSSLPPEERSHARLWQESFNLFIAGIDTTSRLTAHATYRLLNSPDDLWVLRQELDAAWPDIDQPPEYRVLQELPFLTACIKETMRCMEQITGRLPVVCPDDLRYGNWVVPAGTPVSMSLNDILLDPKIFREPREFNPQRWLRDGVLHSELDKWFVPFSRGPRMCQGKDLAWAQAYRGLSTIFRRFELELYDVVYERDIEVVSDHFLGLPSPESKSIRVQVKGIRR